jgi:anhydro-N-acetylmuramic acid kinase
VPRKRRTILAVHLGAAADGVDTALVALSGRRGRLRVEAVDSATTVLADSLTSRLRSLDPSGPVRVESLAGLEAEFTLACLRAGEGHLRRRPEGFEPPEAVAMSEWVLDAHSRDRASAGGCVRLGRPERLACGLGVPCVSEFAAAAAGAAAAGAGTEWGDWLLLRDRRLSRVSIHLGAMAEGVFIGAGASARETVSFSAAPAGALLDGLSRRLLDVPFDDGGTAAAQGRVEPMLLAELLGEGQNDPASLQDAGRWGEFAVERFRLQAGKRNVRRPETLLATACEFSARRIAQAVEQLTERPHQVILHGGCARNIHLAGRIRRLLSPTSTVTSEAFSVPLSAWRPVCLAICAAETLDAVRGRQGPVPSAPHEARDAGHPDLADTPRRRGAVSLPEGL